MNSINNDVNLKEEVKERCFEVSLSWYEIHDGKVKVKASSHEEAMNMVKENICKYIDLAKSSQETYSDTTTKEVYEAIVVKEKAKKEESIYREKFDTDVYITTTSYHSAYENNILEIGKVKYRDYVPVEERKYKFSESNIYSERFDYYKVGACPSRERKDVLFEKDDYSKLLSKSLSKVEGEYSFAKSIDEALDKGKYLLMMERRYFKDSKNPRTIQIRAVKIEKGSERAPFGIQMDNQYMAFANRENITNKILNCRDILACNVGCNNSKLNLFLNTQEGLKVLNKTVIDTIGYTF